MRRGQLYGKRRSEVGYWSLRGQPPKGRPETQMRSILKRIGPIKDRVRRVVARERNVDNVILTIGVTPNERVQVYTCRLKSGLAQEFTSLGIDIAIVMYLFQG
jgi:hypothetical protein